MTVPAALGLWIVELLLVAALAATPRGARLGFALALLALPLPFALDAAPAAVAAFALAFLWTAVRAADLMATDAPAGGLARSLHLVALLDPRTLAPASRRLDGAALLRTVVAAALALVAIRAVVAADDLDGWARYAVRWSAGALLAMAALEGLAAGLEVLVAASGRRTPPLHDAPHLARSVAEFWGRRWNRIVARVLHERAFLPAARLGPFWGLTAAFALSAAFHAYLIGPAAGPSAALAWAAFFLIQPPVIALERRLAVRRWPAWAGRAWTIGTVGAASPLMVEPALRALGG